MFGAQLDNKFHGAAWFYKRAGTSWILEGTEITGEKALGAGVGLSFTGGTVIIGEPGNSTYKGAAHFYTTPEEAAYLFRPNLYFDTNEKWRPLTVASFLSEGSRNQVCTEHGGTCYALTGPEALTKATGSSAYIDHAGNYNTEGTNPYRSPYPECISGERQDCDTGAKSSIYYHVVGPHAGYTYIDYWMLYRFNYYGEIPAFLPGNHEGDWEAVTVAPALARNTFDFASFSQHGTFFSYLRAVMSCDGGKQGSCGTGAEGEVKGQHVSVFPAYGDHANYPETCNSGCFETEPEVPGTPERAHDGSEPWGNNASPGALLALPATGTGQWVDWLGRWGNEAHGNSTEIPPASPANQTPHFTEPWASKCTANPLESNCFYPGRLRAHSSSTAYLSSLAARSQLLPITGATDVPSRHVPGAVNYCANWFGSGVEALLCDPKLLSRAIRTRSITPAHAGGFVRQPGLRTATTAAVAQAVGQILKLGQTLRLRGPVRPEAQLFVRAENRRRLVRARFTGLRIKRGETRTVVIGTASGWPTVAVRGRGHREVVPTEARRQAIG